MMSVPFFTEEEKLLGGVYCFLKESRDKLIASLNDFPSPQLSDNLRIYDAVLSTTLFMSPENFSLLFPIIAPSLYGLIPQRYREVEKESPEWAAERLKQFFVPRSAHYEAAVFILKGGEI